MSSNPLNDLSQVYLDQVANVKKAENEADIQRWEEIGGPTPTNYKPTGGSAKIKTESKNRSDWRNDLFEAGDPDATQTPGFKKQKDSEKKIKEVAGINNKVVINPKLNEAIKEIGGEVIVAEEVEEIDEDDQTRQQQLQRKQLMIDRQKLQLRRRALGKKKKENNDGGSETEAQANVIANEGVMTMIGRKKKEKKAEKAMDAGARAKRMLARKIHAKYVSGSTENVPDDIRETSAVLDANKNLEKEKKTKKDKAELAKLTHIYKGMKKGIYNSYEPEGEVIEGYAKPKGMKDLPKGSKVRVKKGVKVQGKYVNERTLASYIPSDRQGEVHRANLDYTKAQLKKKEDESTKNRGDLSKRDAGKMAKERLHNKKIMSMGEAEDKAFNFVVNKLKSKYGDGVLTKGDKMPEPSAAQKKKNAEIRAKRAKQDGRDATEKASDGRYSDRYSNRGSD